MADTVVQELVINTLTQAQFDAAKEAGTLSPYELYGTPDTSARLPVLTPMWFDHIANGVSWLRADTFSWQSGDVYVAAYEHLVADYESATTGYSWTGDTTGIIYITKGMPSVGDTVVGGGYTVGEVSSLGITVYKNGSPYETATLNSAVNSINTSQTETIGDITITYYLADDGHKICLPDQESNIVALYNKTGAANYYLLDTTNNQFKLPRKQKRTLIQAVKNADGTWYNLYSDGWVEQGGHIDGGVGTLYTVNLPLEMSDVKYSIILGVGGNNVSGGFNSGYRNQTTTSFTFIFHNNGTSNDNFGSWQVSGYAAESAYASAGMRLEYYYVGNFEQSAIEQTAGITAETLNGKADSDLGNIPANYDYVVESQFPTADNGYTWYRKYKSGWVEQGGRCTVPATNGLSSSSVTVTLPVPIATPEQATLAYNGMGTTGYYSNCENQATLTATTVTIGRWNNGNPVAEARYYNWTLSGMSAQ